MDETRPDYRSTTLAKGLALLRAIVADNARSSLSELARAQGIPLATAHRLALTLETEGFVARVRKGCFKPGPALAALTDTISRADPLVARLRRPLARLARDSGAFVHYGVLEEGMVTYLIKEAPGTDSIFTAEAMQLEAYCSAIGKVLLAALPEPDLDAYLATGPFVALTAQTITDPERLFSEIATVRREGLGFDRHEIREDLFCVGVPVGTLGGSVRGAISLSFLGEVPDGERRARLVQRVRRIGASALKAVS